MRDIDAAEEWLDAWEAGVDARAALAAELAQRVSGVSARARSADGTVSVTVGANGQIEDLHLDDPRLARQILAVMRIAQHRLNQQVADEVRSTVGGDSATGQAVLDAFARRYPDPDVR
ncbi:MULTISPECIES: YbaB/EbfC family nucleoid-associated protein [Actinoplanes]|uniref:YbaB/EbfC family nucleoid-associated protein n=1 Tax=Actinoplanes TaxID=1865 RepID=UPI0006987A8E|nr:MULTISPECIES: YbaB/EbfC family nucleoid-associated protein [Actinoplanes]GLY06975.1 hypothetical protein Acsp01_73540 [Actinoplanes sp. NBRC 101535]